MKDKVYLKGAYLIEERNGEVYDKTFYSERALAFLLIHDHIILNSRWWFDTDKELTSVSVDCSDVFMWGCAEGEDLPFNEIESLYNYVKKDKIYGAAIWCIIRRKEMPQQPVEEKIRKMGIWDLDELKVKYELKENSYELYLKSKKEEKGE